MNLFPDISQGLNNIANANGVIITAAGMLFVFLSLSLITIILKITPYALKIISGYFPEKEVINSKSNRSNAPEPEEVAAISNALYHSAFSSKK